LRSSDPPLADCAVARLDAWELNIVTSGVAAWVVIDGYGNHESFDQHVGEIVFAPQGSFHYFENRNAERGPAVKFADPSASATA
jgi:oxalate decarboxylase